MERQTTKKPLNGNKTTNVDDPSLHYPRSLIQHKNSRLKDPSFSSYLVRPEPPKSDDNGFANDDSDQISVFDAENYFSEKNHEQRRDSLSANNHLNQHHKTAVVDDQRGVAEFAAVLRLSSVSSADGGGKYGGARSFHATPTASSEASWNSQTGLLSNPRGSIPILLRNVPDDDNQKKVGSSSNARWFSGLKCPCYGKNSVQVEDKLSEPRSPQISSYPKRQSPKSIDHRSSDAENQSMNPQTSSISSDFQRLSSENHFGPKATNHHHHRGRRRHHHQGLGSSFHDGTGFSFPILNNQSFSKLQIPTRTPSEEPPRESLEVFQPPDDSISRNPMDIQHRRGYGFPASPMSRITGTEDDVASDASSDLFEIESFSTQTTYRCRDSIDEAAALYGRRQSLDEPVTPSVAATEAYEPSEASINWSVTTAEGFDRGSVTNFSISASEFGDAASMRRLEAEKTGGGYGWGKRRSGRNGGALLMSCRWEKAVSVGPTQQGKWGQEEGGGGLRAVGGGGPPLQLISTTRHVSRTHKR